VGIGCFAVARNANDYHLLFNSEAANFRRSESTDGGVNWADLGLVTGLAAPWMTGVQCPDPHFDGTSGKMTLYFSATRTAAAGGNWTIGRATSTDNGSSWTTDLNQLVLPTSSHFPYMPSAIPVPGGWLLSYAWICNGSLTEGATIDVLFSADGLTNWVPRAVPAISTGACNRWDDGSVNRPRLVVDPLDPTGQTIHMFFSAYEWDGTKVTRHCGRIGRAKSTDGGFTWTKATRPVFEPAVGATNWDDKQVLKPSLVFEPCPNNPANSILRLFYEGAGYPANGGLGGLGIADAAWPLGSVVCPSAQIALDEEVDSGDEARPHLTSVPNPTRGTTTIQVEFSQPRVAGEAEISIIDVTGRLVRHLWSGSSLTAPHSIDWDGRESTGALVAPGRYLALMRISGTNAATHWITMTR
jgi:hypothetical protein